MAALVPPSCKVYTPDALAKAVINALGDEEGVRWLEPCAGHGAFLSALAMRGIPKSRITALDLEAAVPTHLGHARVSTNIDFLQWATETRERFDRIICNPPYVSINRLASPLRDRATGEKYPDGTPIRATANYWCAFLCAALRVMRDGASLGFILPAAWEFARYAGPLRSSLPAFFGSFEVHRCLKPLFDEVQEGSVVLIGRGYGRPYRGSTRHEHRTPDALRQALSVSRIHRVQTGVCLAAVGCTGRRRVEVVRLSDVVDVRIGGVTGDARYFLLTDKVRRELKLPRSTLRPVLSKARHLCAAEMNVERWRRLLQCGERVWLFSPSPAVCALPAVRRYLELSRQDGGCDRKRFKIAGRRYWWETPMPTEVQGFMSGMGRTGPWICLSTMPKLSATNTLYVVTFKRVSTLEERAAWALALITTDVRSQLASRRRLYADGLAKHEPGDLQDLQLTVPAVRPGAREVYIRCIERLLASDFAGASAIADEWISN